MSSPFSRRQAIKSGLVAAIGTALVKSTAASPFEKGATPFDEQAWQDFKVGIASYTFRKLSLDDTIKAMQRLGLKYISVKDFHLALTSSAAERTTAMQKLKAAGITPMSCGNITMQNDEKDIRRAFQYAKDCDMPVIVCSPHPDSMPILDKLVKEFDIKLAIHNHGPEDKRFPSPYDVMKVIKGYDQRIGLCIDVGHTARAKVNPAEAIVKCKERLYDLHFKDINTTEANGKTIEAGRGVLDLPSIVRAMQKIKYPYLVSIEFEEWADDPIPSVAETVGYARGLMNAGMKS
ncbi:MAG TPA: sugar phosphate isomerase/epimerase [Chitinophagaceae bacterium]|nr:sugar phosphate isomerase/epimerase [Chitinophagaceae bacterium]